MNRRADSGAHPPPGSDRAQAVVWRRPVELSSAELAAADIVCEREYDNVENGTVVYYDRDGRELDPECDTVAIPARETPGPLGGSRVRCPQWSPHRNGVTDESLPCSHCRGRRRRSSSRPGAARALSSRSARWTVSRSAPRALR